VAVVLLVVEKFGFEGGLEEGAVTIRITLKAPKAEAVKLAVTPLSVVNCVPLRY